MPPLAPADQHRTNGNRQAAAPPVARIPFTAAAHEHTEAAFDVSVLPGANVTQLGPFDVPAFGYIRHLVLEVTASGGVAGPGVLSADGPFNLFQSIAMLDVNGAPIFGPIDGYAALWANIAGGYAYQADPRRGPGYSAVVGAGSPTFILRIPVEITHFDGMGSLANQNAAASYKIQLSVNPAATIYSTAPTTVPTFRIRGWLEAWTLPNEVDLAGRPQAVVPPAHGTTQYWSQFIRAGVAVGQNSILLPRVGNLIRNLVFIARLGTGVRSDTVFPDIFTLMWDARILQQVSQNVLIQQMFERWENVTRDAGVFHLSFQHSQGGRAGDGPPNLWLPTVQSTRLEIQGAVAAAGSIQVVTNDVAPVEVLPAERFVETSATGFTPAGGAPTPVYQ